MDRHDEVDQAEARLCRSFDDFVFSFPRCKEQVEAKLAEAQWTGDEIVQRALAEARDLSSRLAADTERKMTESRAASEKLLGDSEAIKAEAGG